MSAFLFIVNNIYKREYGYVKDKIIKMQGKGERWSVESRVVSKVVSWANARLRIQNIFL